MLFTSGLTFLGAQPIYKKQHTPRGADTLEARNQGTSVPHRARDQRHRESEVAQRAQQGRGGEVPGQQVRDPEPGGQVRAHYVERGQPLTGRRWGPVGRANLEKIGYFTVTA